METELVRPEQPTETRLQAHNLLALIARGLTLDSVPVDKLAKLMEMQLLLENREAERSFHTAMLKCQRLMPMVVKDKKNAQTNSRYATLEAIDRAIRPIYQAHGFGLTFGFNDPTKDGFVKVVCQCIHEDGWVKHYQAEAAVDDEGMKGAKNKTNVQGVNATMTALRNSLTRAIFNIVVTDKLEPDMDGNRPEPCINERQLKSLLALLEQAEGNAVQMLHWIHRRDWGADVQVLNEIPQSRLAECENILKGKIARMQEQAKEPTNETG